MILRLKLALCSFFGPKKPNSFIILSGKVGRKKLNFVSRKNIFFQKLRKTLAESADFLICCRGCLGVSKYSEIQIISKLI